MSEEFLHADRSAVESAVPRYEAPGDDTVLLCFSHLRWDFVFQRPQHLMTRFAKRQRVYYIEEPVFEEIRSATLRIERREDRLRVVVPVLPFSMAASATPVLRLLLDRLLEDEDIERYCCWYYTPMALAFSEHLAAECVVYDCMDELTGFIGAPTAMARMEQRLIERADVMFTGGHSLYEAKRRRHDNIHPFPSSIDRTHFAKARLPHPDPADQRHIGRPRFGFFGVIDERFDIELMAKVAALRPGWQYILLGPVVKIDPASLPRAANLHYLGMKRYDELPAYLANWDVAMMPFARNEATRYISPTKTPEYLAGGRPVVSTRIHDVVHPYATQGLVHVADTADEFVAAGEAALGQSDASWLARVDAFLGGNSWDATWEAMDNLVCLASRTPLLMRLAAARQGKSVAA